MWFKVDDKLHDNRKVRQAGHAAMGVWVLAGAWCADNLTDGFVPETVLSRWGHRKYAQRLVDAGLWTVDEQDGESGWRFHEWTSYQPDRSQIEARRFAARERMAKAREKNSRNRGNAKG